MRRRQAALTLVELLVIIAIVGMLVALLLPFKRSAREPARRNSCLNNIKNIGLALHAYEQEHGALPPAYTVDEQGNRLHSWRTLLLPYIEQSRLYESIDLTKPWDDPVNAKARETIVEAYQCPSSPELDGLTNYLAVIGPECAFSGSEPRKLLDVKDDSEETLAIIDSGTDRAVPWMSPEDIDHAALLKLPPDARMNHPSQILALFLDGSPQNIPIDIDRDLLRAMLTISGGEDVELP
jgi:type II secretory pathway pseudopilin PulG